MHKQHSGDCPVQHKPYTITINYVEDSTFEGKEKSSRGTCRCEYVAVGNKYTVPRCPIWEKAPEHI